MRWILMLTMAMGAARAQDVPGDWKLVKDRAGACQLAVPPDWVADKLVAAFVQSPDKNADALPHGVRNGGSLADVVNSAKATLTPDKTIEESAKRIWFSYRSASGEEGTHWYVAVAGSPVCTAQINFKASAMDAVARKIALSLKQAK